MLFKQIPYKLAAVMASLGLVMLVIIIIYNVNDNQMQAEVTVCQQNEVDTLHSTLELVHIVMRHGARTPVDTYPSDPYINSTFYPTGWGQLTNAGKSELFELGKWLKQRYRKFLPAYYMPDTLHAQATASPRALMSLSTVLASLFPPFKTPMEWHNEINWQPIPILSEPLQQDSLLLVRTPCPRYAEAREEVFALPEVKAELAKYQSLFHNLSALTGMTLKTAEDINSIYITLQAEQEFGLKLPTWTKQYYPDQMQFLAEQSYIYNAYTPEMQKIKGGPFLQKMFNEMQAKCAGKLNPAARQLYMYAGHDWTVGNILSALQVWERQMPRFAVTAIFELHRHRESGECYIELFLRNSEAGCAMPLTIPNCTKKCSLEKVFKLMQHVLPMDTYEERCQARNKSFIEPPSRHIEQMRG